MTTSVYIVECAGYVKIGVAGNVAARLKGINTGAPVRATLYKAREFSSKDVAHQVESRLHRLFIRKCSNNEWFDITPQEAWAALLKVKVPEPRPAGKPKSHHLGPETDQWAMDELRAAMNAAEAQEHPFCSR